MLLAMEHAEDRGIESLTETLKKIPQVFKNMKETLKHIKGKLTLKSF